MCIQHLVWRTATLMQQRRLDKVCRASDGLWMAAGNTLPTLQCIQQLYSLAAAARLWDAPRITPEALATLGGSADHTEIVKLSEAATGMELNK